MVLHQGSPGLAVDPGEVLAEISRRLSAPAQGKPDRDKLATMLKANGFTSRDGTYLQGGTYGVIDAVLSALSSTSQPTAAPMIGNTNWCGHGMMASLCPTCSHSSPDRGTS